MTPRSVARICVRFTGKNPPRDFNSHVVSSEFRKQGKCVVTSETNVHVRWSPRVRNECSVAPVWKISSRRLIVLGAAWMLTEMHVVKFSGAIAAMRNWSEVTLVRRLRENRAASVTAPRAPRWERGQNSSFTPIGPILLSRTHPRFTPWALFCRRFAAGKALATSASLPPGLVLISPDNDIRNVVITLPSSYDGDGE